MDGMICGMNLPAYLKSPKFLQAHGGWDAVAWVCPKIEADHGRQPARSRRGRRSERKPRVTGVGRMKSKTEYLTFNTQQKRQYINITDKVEQVVSESGIREGMVLVSAMHITAGVWVNDAESGLLADIDDWLEHLAPYREDYRHHRTGETNGDAHLKSLLVHHQVILPITDGRLDLGPWQQVYYAEFDGQRRKRLVIKAIGE